MSAFNRKPRPGVMHSPTPKPVSQALLHREPHLPHSSAPWFPIGRTAPSADGGDELSPPVTPVPPFDFARISVLPCSEIQPKLKVGAPDDALEREADAVADRVVNGPLNGATLKGAKGAVSAQIHRKCAKCEHDEVQRRLIQRKATNGPSVAGRELQGQLSSAKGNGHALPVAVGNRMSAAIGFAFDRVRIHTDESAAQMNSALSARAFTHGTDIYFNRGEYNPGTRTGQHLLAHELAHVAQQGGAEHILYRSGGVPGNVSLVEISRASNTITFHTTDGEFTYQLSLCEVVDGEFEADVVVDEESGKFRLNVKSDEVAVDAFRFDFDIGPGQKNPSILLGGQKTVKVSVQTAQTRINAAASLGEFKKMVKEAGKLRMDSNKTHLEEWKKFFTEKLGANQSEGQVLASRANQLGTAAARKGGMALPTFDKWARTENPLLAWVYEKQISEDAFTACTACHATVQAEERWRNRPAYITPPRSPVAALQQHAENESASPAPRPQGAGQESPIAELGEFMGYDTALQAMHAVKVLRPYLDELGPARYDILPPDAFNSMKSPAELLATIVASINKRQADYELFKRRIDSPDFDYLTLRPVVQDLLLLATLEVQQEVGDEMAAARNWELVKGIALGGATIGLLVLAVFPPTSALGIAGVLALDASLAAYGVYSGVEMYQQGSWLAKGTGAHDVIDPEQQKSADTMMAMGLLSVGLSALSLGMTGVRALTLIRSSNNGTRAAGAVVSIEAQLEDGRTVKVTELAGSNPKVVVLGKDGELLAEGTLPVTPLKMHHLPENGIFGATPRAGTTARPLSFQGEAPTCGPVSCEMIARMNKPVRPDLLKDMLKEAGKTGVYADQVVEMLKWNRIASEAQVGWKVADLAAATKGGNPVIATIKTANRLHPLHFVVVDGVTVRNGVRVVAIRNPWGIQYFQAEEEFAKIFTGTVVKVLHWY